MPRKETLIVGDSIIKDVEAYMLNKRMKSQVFVKSMPAATTKGMIHHVK